MTLEEQFHHDRIKALQARFPATEHTILALQKEYNEALDAFRIWARDNPCQVPKDKTVHKTELVNHKIEWISPTQIRILP